MKVLLDTNAVVFFSEGSKRLTPESYQTILSPETEVLHRDPADRILIATARLGNMTLITSDDLILQYPHVRSIS